MSDSRSAVIATADTYLQGGLIAGDPSLVKLDPDCVRSENGWDTGGTRIMSDYFPRMTMVKGIRNLRWLVEGDEAVARFDLQVEGGYEVPIIEYFRVGPNGICEIAPTFPMEGWMDNAIGPADERFRRVRPAPARSGAEAHTIDLAERTFSALVGGRPDLAPLGPDVTLTDNGQVTGRGRAEVVAALGQGLWAQATSARLLHWVVEGPEAVGRFEVETQGDGLVVGGLYLRAFGDQVRELQSTWGAGPSSGLLARFRSAAPAED
jgi:hypothetical protein